MSEEQKYTIQGLDEYIRQGEPQQCRLTIYTAFIDSFINMALERLMTTKY